MSSKPTIVIAPGSFASTELYDDLKSQLIAQGYETIVISLPSVGTKDQVSGISLEDDATRIKETIRKFIEQGKEIVQIMHSYGGIPGSESAKGLLKADLEVEGKPGGIAHLVYMAAVIAPVGQALMELDMGTRKEGLNNLDASKYYSPIIHTY
jgi:hypothetical protein